VSTTGYEIEPMNSKEFLDSHPDHIGFSLTMPLKDRLVTLAVERGWNVDDTAALTAAGNTLVRRSGQVQVANTDVQAASCAPSTPHMEAEP
jgi:shikimate dehydrogenase